MSELGYITVVDRQGRKIARECMKALVSHLFERENHRRVFVEIDNENVASVASSSGLASNSKAACANAKSRIGDPATCSTTACSVVSGKRLNRSLRWRQIDQPL
jgi:hypothetical protein